MTVVLIEPMKLGDRMDETTYRCPRCGNELKLAAKRRPSATQPPSGITIHITAEVDPDTPRPQGYWHWIVVDLPSSTTQLPRDAGAPSGKLLPAGAYQLTNDGGTTGYAGAWPPPGDRAHRYFFAVHALDVDHLDADVASDPRDVAAEAAKHTLARAVIVPVFRR